MERTRMASTGSDSLPLSPSAVSPLRAPSPGLDQLALPVDSFSELLACLDG